MSPDPRCVPPPVFSPCCGTELVSQKVTNPVKRYSGSMMPKDMFLRKTTRSLCKKVVFDGVFIEPLKLRLVILL